MTRDGFAFSDNFAFLASDYGIAAALEKITRFPSILPSPDEGYIGISANPVSRWQSLIVMRGIQVLPPDGEP